MPSARRPLFAIRTRIVALVAAALLTAAPSWATCTIKQVVSFPTAGTMGCPAGNQCTLGPFSATTAGSTLALGFGIQGNGYSNHQVRISSAYTCSSNPPCDPTNGNVIDSFSILSNHMCAVFYSSHSVDCAYVIAGVGGATYLTINTTDTVQLNRWFPSMAEAQSSTGTQTFDTEGTAQNTTTSTTQPGATLTLGGANDFIFQIIDAGGGESQITPDASCSGQTYSGLFDDHYGAAYSLNTSCGAAPSWTCTGNMGMCASAGVSGAIAFKE